ncbi:hypothetical protein L6E12_27650 [Actinokineospora sp. PR83]|uniref:hypothetical protein n=1 Tax=Actinokineospora sp. PR83 TaxID=2884908 RepID=UPI001F33DD43|nr:hypothetical protein [Actinokineospora sp. PR83]MCG8919554.1 hypothetical protein [Actinokineospora sp. PR83]
MVERDPNAFTVDVHGNERHPRIGERELSVRDTADIIRSSQWDGKQPVRLISCRAGAADGGFAAELARELGVPVTAPTRDAWVDDRGRVFSSSAHHLPDARTGQYRVGPGWPPNGEWRTFRPDGSVVGHGQPQPPGAAEVVGEPRRAFRRAAPDAGGPDPLQDMRRRYPPAELAAHRLHVDAAQRADPRLRHIERDELVALHGAIGGSERGPVARALAGRADADTAHRVAPQVHNARAAVAKLPPFHGRAHRVVGAVPDTFHPGNRVVDPGFAVATAHPAPPRPGQPVVEFHIDSAAARDVSGLAGRAPGSTAVLPPGTPLVVRSRHVDPVTGNLHVLLSDPDHAGGPTQPTRSTRRHTQPAFDTADTGHTGFGPAGNDDNAPAAQDEDQRSWAEHARRVAESRALSGVDEIVERRPAPERSGHGPDAGPARVRRPLSDRLEALADERLDDLVRSRVEATPAGMSLFDAETGPNQRHTARQVAAIEGRFVVDVHGAEHSARVGHSVLSARDVADVLKANPDYRPGTPVVLLGCGSGAVEDGFAARLAQATGAPVTAPNTDAWVTYDGTVFASEARGSGPGWPPGGEWRTHRPDGGYEVHPGPHPPGHTPSWGSELPRHAPETATRRGPDSPAEQDSPGDPGDRTDSADRPAFPGIDPDPPANVPHDWPADPTTGYTIRDRDLDFLGLDREQVEAWMAREAPLGMDAATYRQWRVSLLEALHRDGVDPSRVDVRMRGSGADFFSGVHKELPTEADLADHPEALSRLRDWFGDDPERPRGRPFDAMHRLGLEEPSDFDINVSSAQMFERARANWDPDAYPGELAKDHGYLNKALVRDEYPHLRQWAEQWTARSGREMSYAVFGGDGPADMTHQGFHVHFQETDWIVARPGGEPDSGPDGGRGSGPDGGPGSGSAGEPGGAAEAGPGAGGPEPDPPTPPEPGQASAVSPDLVAEREWSRELSRDLVYGGDPSTTSEQAKSAVISAVTDRVRTPTDALLRAAAEPHVPVAAVARLGDGDHAIRLRNPEHPSMGGTLVHRSELEPGAEGVLPLDAPGAERLLRETAVSELLMSWAHTSNGTNVRSLAIQEAAEAEFGLRGVQGWRMDEALRADVDRAVVEHGAVHRELLRVQYELTQGALAARGVNALVLYRGYSWPGDDRPEWSRAPEGAEIDMPGQRPLSAWTGDRRVAEDWLGGRPEPGVILAARVPREAVLAYPQTGIGCLWQIEFVVLAGRGSATVDVVHGGGG